MVSTLNPLLPFERGETTGGLVASGTGVGAGAGEADGAAFGFAAAAALRAELVLTAADGAGALVGVIINAGGEVAAFLHHITSHHIVS